MLTSVYLKFHLPKCPPHILLYMLESVMDSSLIPPSFGDLGKSARNLFDKGFGKSICYDYVY